MSNFLKNMFHIAVKMWFNNVGFKLERNDRIQWYHQNSEFMVCNSTGEQNWISLTEPIKYLSLQLIFWGCSFASALYCRMSSCCECVILPLRECVIAVYQNLLFLLCTSIAFYGCIKTSEQTWSHLHSRENLTMISHLEINPLAPLLPPIWS